MKIRNAKFIFFILFLIFGNLLFCQQAKVTFIKGKAEVLKNDSWVLLKVGSLLRNSDVVSTGFQSELRLEINGTICALGSLTRLKIENIKEGTEKDDISLFLNTGSVRSKVKPTSNKRIGYVVKSPIATASVRGTDFIVTSNGNISCSEGAVAVYRNEDILFHNEDFSSPSEENEEKQAQDDLIIENSNTKPVIVTKNHQVGINQNGRIETITESLTRQNVAAKNKIAPPSQTEASILGTTSLGENSVNSQILVEESTQQNHDFGNLNITINIK